MTRAFHLSFLVVFAIIGLSCSDMAEQEEPIIIGVPASDVGQECGSGCKTVCLEERAICSDYCNDDTSCPTDFECGETIEGSVCLPKPTVPQPEPEPECAPECGSDELCINVVTDERLQSPSESPYCAAFCESSCPTGFKCERTRIGTIGLDFEQLCVKSIKVAPEPEPAEPLTYLRPQRNTTISFDQGEMLLQWEAYRLTSFALA